MIVLITLEMTLLIFRLTGLMTFLPVFNDGRLPRTVKIGFALLLGWTLTAVDTAGSHLASPLVQDPQNVLRIIIAIGSEFIFGASIGFTFSLLFEPARIAGAYISQEIGLNMAELTDPTSQHSTNVVAQILMSLAILLFFTWDMHHFVLNTIGICLSIHPLGAGFFPQDAVVATQTDLACQWGLVIASPIGIAGFVTVFCLALLMRAVPQMNIFAIGITLRLAVGLFSFVVFLPVILRLVQRIMNQAIDSAGPLISAIG